MYAVGGPSITRRTGPFSGKFRAASPPTILTADVMAVPGKCFSSERQACGGAPGARPVMDRRGYSRGE